MASTIPAAKMTVAEVKALNRLIAELEPQFALCSWLPFVADGRLAGVFVGQKRDASGLALEDCRYYVFRAYSDIAGGGIEYDTRHDDKAVAIAAKWAAAEGHADLIYDNRKR